MLLELDPPYFGDRECEVVLERFPSISHGRGVVNKVGLRYHLGNWPGIWDNGQAELGLAVFRR